MNSWWHVNWIKEINEKKYYDITDLTKNVPFHGVFNPVIKIWGLKPNINFILILGFGTPMGFSWGFSLGYFLLTFPHGICTFDIKYFKNKLKMFVFLFHRSLCIKRLKFFYRNSLIGKMRATPEKCPFRSYPSHCFNY